METTTCVRCHSRMSDGNKFCPECGTPCALPHSTSSVTTSDCPTCHKPVEAGQRFCVACGTALGGYKSEAHGAAEPKTGAVTPTVPVPPPAAVKEVPATPPVPSKTPGGSVPTSIKLSGSLHMLSFGNPAKEFPLDKDIMNIGKDPRSDIPVSSDHYASHTHARLFIRDGQIHLEDLGSRNGTFIEIRDAVRLRDGDRILIGTTVFQFAQPSTEVPPVPGTAKDKPVV